jgi:hypothetical protein
VRLALPWLVLAGCAGIGAEAGGFVAAEGRLFVQSPKYPGQETGNGVSLVVEPRLELKGDRHSVLLQPFYRLDPTDERRSHADLREARYRLLLEHFEFSAGAGIFNWGVLEAHRPGDVMNQSDFVESIDGSVKLGQPFAELGWIGEAASLKLYYLPYFRERTFPGIRGRPRFGAVVDTDHPQFETELRQLQPSGAARFTLNAGELDLGASIFSGLSREPRFILELTSGQVAPRYELMHQGSVDVQLTIDALTFKAEGFVRLWSTRLRVFGGGAVGIDYTFFKLFNEASLTLAAEFFFDTRPLDAPITFYDHDVFAGLRFALNDVANTELTAGAVVDVFDQSTFVRVQLSRRLAEHFKVFLDANLYFGTPGKLTTSFVRDNFGQLRLAYFF